MTNIALGINSNFLSPNGFKFSLKKLPHVEYFCQKFDFPGLSIGQASPPLNTPFSTLTIAGDHVSYDNFSVEFKIDEDMNSYFEISDWIQGLGFPDSFDQYSALAAQNQLGLGVLSDASITILSNTMEPNIRIDFVDVQPIQLSGFTMSSVSSDISYITAKATFKFRTWNYTRIA